MNEQVTESLTARILLAARMLRGKLASSAAFRMRTDGVEVVRDASAASQSGSPISKHQSAGNSHWFADLVCGDGGNSVTFNVIDRLVE